METTHDAVAARFNQLVEAVRALNSNPDPVSSINQYASTMQSLYGDQALISVTTRGLAAGEYRVMRFLHQTGISETGLGDTPYAGPEAPVHRGGFLGGVVSRGEAAIMRELAVREDPVLGNALAPYRVLVATPAYGLGPLTNWVFFLKADPDGFTDMDIEARILQANLMSGITTSKRARFELLEATKQIQHEIDEIAGLMNGLMPAVLPDIPGVEAAASFETFDRAGGDYYDLFPLPGDDGAPPRHWGVMIADASGHGASAAVMVAMMSALLHSYPEADYAPGAVLARLNRHLLHRQRSAFFVTAIFGVYDTGTRQFRYSSAGHPAPILAAGAGAVWSLGRGGGLPLGIAAHARYDEQTVSLEAGQSLVLYTDGITEAMSPAHELFGDERFAGVLARDHAGPAALVNAVKDALRHHQRGERPKDDQTMLVLRIDS